MTVRFPRFGAHVLVTVVLLASLAALSGCGGAGFSHDVTGPLRPWTNENFRGEPDDLRFAIVSDRCGGHRPGVFPAALGKLELLQPEFVLCVGDLIEGYTEDPDKLAAQHDELEGIVGKLSMPFFFLPGNHDVTNETMVSLWETRIGPRHYSFVYKNVLFLILDSQDGPRGKNGQTSPGLSDRQVRWARQAIARRPGVRWTFVLLHQPLWVYEEGGLASARKKTMKPMNTGFPKVEEALADRDYTVIAGHYHQYIKGTRHGRKYIILASTGGSSALGGPDVGEFDEIVWVSVTPDGPPRLANLLLDGILDENVLTETGLRFAQDLSFADVKTAQGGKEMRFALPIANPFEKELVASVAWDVPAGSAWEVAPEKADTRIAPGQSGRIDFTARAAKAGKLFPLPVCRVGAASGGDAWKAELLLPMDVDAYLRAHRPTLTAPRAAKAVSIDGKLDDAAWQSAPDVPAFQSWMLDADPTVETQAWVSWDDQYYYIAMRCDEPRMDLLQIGDRKRDDAIWEDDCIDVMIGPDAAKPETYYQIIVNPAGAVYDARGMDKKFDTGVQAAATRDAGGWTVELAVPWAKLGAKPAPGAKMTFLLSRSRPQKAGDKRQILQYPPLNGWNHRSENHGRLVLGQ